mgnify:CR=1 FL=1
MERKTRQRELILEIIKRCYTHPTIKELYSLVNNKYPDIGQATVYRTVNKLVNDDIIKRIDCPDGIHYDYRKDHYHFYCLNCNNITDVFLEKDLVDKLLLSSNLEDVKHINLVFEGICSKCKK